MQFVDWVAAYVLAPPGLVLRQVMRVPAAFEPEKPVFGYQASGVVPDRMTPARQRVLDVMQDTPPLPGTELARLAGFPHPSSKVCLMEAPCRKLRFSRLQQIPGQTQTSHV